MSRTRLLLALEKPPTSHPGKAGHCIEHCSIIPEGGSWRESVGRHTYETVSTAWNLSFYPEPEREEAKIAAIEEKEGTAEDRMEAGKILDTMIARKLELFPRDDRFIVSYQCREDDRMNFLSAASVHIPGCVLSPEALRRLRERQK